jgi:hypothetical protein
MKVVIVTKRTLAHGFGGVEGYRASDQDDRDRM